MILITLVNEAPNTKCFLIIINKKPKKQKKNKLWSSNWTYEKETYRCQKMYIDFVIPIIKR